MRLAGHGERSRWASRGHRPSRPAAPLPPPHPHPSPTGPAKEHVAGQAGRRLHHPLPAAPRADCRSGSSSNRKRHRRRGPRGKARARPAQAALRRLRPSTAARAGLPNTCWAALLGEGPRRPHPSSRSSLNTRGPSSPERGSRERRPKLPYAHAPPTHTAPPHPPPAPDLSAVPPQTRARHPTCGPSYL